MKKGAPKLSLALSVYQVRHAALLVKELGEIARAETPLLLHLPNHFLPANWSGYRPHDSSEKTDPSGEVLDNDSKKILESLVKEGSVNLLPAGFTGAVQAFLTEEEARLEAEWSLSNPWKNGLRDIFGLNPRYLLPFWPDESRNNLVLASLRSFSAYGLGVKFLGDSSGFLLLASAQGYEALPYLRIDNPKNFASLAKYIKRGLKELQNHRGGHKDFEQILVHLPYLPKEGGLEGLRTTLDELTKDGFLFDSELLPLPLESFGSDLREGTSLAPLAHFGLALGPGFRQRLQKQSEIRRSRSTVPERIRSQLLISRPDYLSLRGNPACKKADSFESFALSPQETPQAPAAQKPKSKSLLSSMQGDALLISDDYDILFRNGHLKTFKKAEAEISFENESASYFVNKGKKAFFETESSVSFDSDHSRGLRHGLAVRPEGTRAPGRLTVDYLLSDRSAYLFLDAKIRFPWFDQDFLLEEFCPFSLCIPLGEADRVEIAWKNPDKEIVSKTLICPREPQKRRGQPFYKAFLNGDFGRNEKEAPPLFSGSEWTITWSRDGNKRGLVFRKIARESELPNPFQVRLRQEKSGLSLRLFPEGLYESVSTKEIRGLSQNFVLALYPLIGLEVPALDELTDRELNLSGFFAED